MSNVLSVLELQLSDLQKSLTERPETGNLVDISTMSKARALLIRSILSTINTIVVQASCFFHPYIQRTLASTLLAYAISVQQSDSSKSKATIPEVDLLRNSLDRLLEAIASKIPPRLAAPMLLSSTPHILSIGNDMTSKGSTNKVMYACAKRYADMVGELFRNLDRPSVLAHMKDLSALATLLLDYRRVYGDQSSDAATVDEAVSAAVVELSLKLTETELKHVLLRLMEWRDASSESVITSWKAQSRAVSFYTLIQHLNSSLGAIFLPAMSLMWTHAATSLTSLEKSIAEHRQRVTEAAGEEGEAGGKKKKSKKRKKRDLEAGLLVALSEEIIESRTLCEKIAASVTLCCKNDSDGFINEVA